MTPAVQNRRSQRSNSTSSSVLTVRKSLSLSSKQNPRSAHLRAAHSISPDQGATDYLAPIYPSQARRGSADEGRALLNNRNINRWSQSTSSSSGAVDPDQNRKPTQNTSRRMSNSLEQSGKSPQKAQYRSQKPSIDVDKSFLVPGSAGSPRSGRSANGSVAGLTPTSVYNTTTGDYFGEPWQNRKTNKFGDKVTAMSIQYVTASQQRPRQIDDVAEEKKLPKVLQESNSSSNVRQITSPEVSSMTQNPEAKRSRGHRSPTQKTMLSRALAKANNAVLLDNSSNIDGAIEAYAEACDLLQQVMMRSSDNDDRKKLSAIRKTYSNRIAELHDLDDPFATLMEKELPDDPPNFEANKVFFEARGPSAVDALEQVQIPPRAESLLPQIYGGESYMEDTSKGLRKNPVALNKSALEVPMESQYMPPPLSPRRQTSEIQPEPSERTLAGTPSAATSATSTKRTSSESTSWLDTMNDGDSVKSQKSRMSRISSSRLQAAGNSLSSEIEDEFDAALNAAVDAAYDSEEVETEETPKLSQKSHLFDMTTSSQQTSQKTALFEGRARADSDVEAPRDYLDEDTTEEEERLLDEMTDGYVFDDLTFDSKTMSALPRQSDSSTFSGRTQSSSNHSTTLTAATNLSILAEDLELAKAELTSESILPQHPVEQSKSPPKAGLLTSPQRPERLSATTLRDRRLSGQNALKIETYAPTRGTAQARVPSKLDVPAPDVQKPLPLPGPPSTGTLPVTPLTSIHSNESLPSDSPATPALVQGRSRNSLDDFGGPMSPSKLTRTLAPVVTMRKNLSSTSLKQRNTSISASMDDQSPLTPASALPPHSAGFPDMRPQLPPLPTPTTATFTHQTSFSGGMHLFDDQIGFLASPKTPRSSSGSQPSDPPIPLEPCPEAFLLRPWWLMRCLYQVVAHPRGGHLTNKMFLPREMWKVKNVKLRFLEDKISQCDILTAALLALAKVDNFDAEAMLEALQSFENELEKVRMVLAKKLGNEVGVSHNANVFRSPTEEEPPNAKAANSSSAAKSFASGWRKLRSKSSSTSAPVSNPVGSFHREAVTGPGLTMPSLPMTSSGSVQTSSRVNNHRYKIPPPTPNSLTNIPVMHATYMSSLARLFDAVQILDAIARQVEDPGLKASNQTHVGLEFCIRTAAEFFSFYIIRFVMADVCVLVDKFLKRGAEWVMA